MKSNNSVTPEPKISKKTNKKKALQNATNKQSNFKTKYFEFYDDVKTHNNGPYDW